MNCKDTTSQKTEMPFHGRAQQDKEWITDRKKQDPASQKKVTLILLNHLKIVKNSLLNFPDAFFSFQNFCHLIFPNSYSTIKHHITASISHGFSHLPIISVFRGTGFIITYLTILVLPLEIPTGTTILVCLYLCFINWAV